MEFTRPRDGFISKRCKTRQYWLTKDELEGGDVGSRHDNSLTEGMKSMKRKTGAREGEDDGCKQVESYEPQTFESLYSLT